jgi:hypothetical protein
MKFGDYTTQMESSLPRRFATAAARTTAMPSPTLNDLTILDTTPGTVEFWDGTNWVEITRSWVGPNAPTWTPTAGDLWLDTDDVAVVPGSQLAYAEITASVTVSATAETSANLVVAAPSLAFDGVTPVIIEVFSPAVFTAPAGGANVLTFLYQDGVSIGRIAGVQAGTTSLIVLTPVYASRRMTPTAGSHAYSWGAIQTGGNGSVLAGPGGVGQYLPAYLRITRA